MFLTEVLQEEFKFYMEDARSKLLVVGREGNAAAQAAGGPPCMRLAVSPPAGDGADPGLEVSSETPGWQATLADTSAGDALPDPPLPADVALFLHTSGTTSRPKGVPLTHTNLAASLDNISRVGAAQCGPAWAARMHRCCCPLAPLPLVSFMFERVGDLLSLTSRLAALLPPLARLARTLSHPARPFAPQTYEFGPSDRCLLVMPLFHVHGLMAGLLAPLAAGSAVIMPASGRFSAGTFWQDAVQHGATFYTGQSPGWQVGVAARARGLPPARSAAARTPLSLPCCLPPAPPKAPSALPPRRLAHASHNLPALLLPPSRPHHAPNPAVPLRPRLPLCRAAAAARHPLVLVRPGARHPGAAGKGFQSARAGGALLIRTVFFRVHQLGALPATLEQPEKAVVARVLEVRRRRHKLAPHARAGSPLPPARPSFSKGRGADKAYPCQQSLPSRTELRGSPPFCCRPTP